LRGEPSERMTSSHRLRYATRLAARKPVAFALAIAQRVTQPLRCWYDVRFPPRLSASEWQSLLAVEAIQPEALRARLRRLLPAPCLRRDDYLARWGHTRGEVVAQAEKICQHRFALLGSGEVALGESIAWQQDFKSGRCWPLEPAYRLRLVYPEDESDVKVPWELSRFQHLPTLGKAYWLTGEERYVREFADQIRHYIAQNPYGHGLNWLVAMEAAIRGVNWLYAANFFLDSASLTPEFWRAFVHSLFLHGRFIRRNLEWNPYARGNHYLANLVGLLYLGAFFADVRTGQRWLNFAQAALGREIDHQVRPDGVDHEASLGYHRLVTEMFLVGALVAARAHELTKLTSPAAAAQAMVSIFGESFCRKLEQMFEFILHYTRPDGLAPNVGDADDGRLFQLVGYGTANPADHRHLLCTAALLFSREDFRQAADDRWEEAWWLLGAENLPPKEPTATPPQLTSRAFPAGGFFVLRGANAYVLVRCGDVGLEGRGAHAHCDQLSFELAIGNQPLVVDPGTYVYTANLEERFRFRSTAYHNTVRVAAAEQNRISPAYCFAMPDETRARVRHWKSTATGDELEGEHFGYRRLLARVVHRRGFYLDKVQPALYVLDHLAGRGRVLLEWFYHFSPQVKVSEQIRPRIFGAPQLAWLSELQPPGSRLQLAYELAAAGALYVPLFIYAAEELTGELRTAWVSQRYGVRTAAPLLTLRGEVTLPVSVLAVFVFGAAG